MSAHREAFATAQTKLVEFWNDNHPPGTEVDVTKDNGDVVRTKTRSEAWLLGGPIAVVMVEGISGGYQLDRISAIK